jgi:putative endonuclease
MDASAEAVIRREKQIKERPRDWKIDLIERDNPQWINLYTSSSAEPMLAMAPATGQR